MAKSRSRKSRNPSPVPIRMEPLEKRLLLTATVYTAQMLPVSNGQSTSASCGSLNEAGDVAEQLFSNSKTPNGDWCIHAYIQYHTGILMDVTDNLLGSQTPASPITINNYDHLLGSGGGSYWFWNGNSKQDVPPFKNSYFGPTDSVRDMNDSDAVVGECRNPNANDTFEGFIWFPGQSAPTPIGLFPGGIASEPTAINNHNTIVGCAYRSDGGKKPFIANGGGGSLTELPGLNSAPEYEACASDINDQGLIIGYAWAPGSTGNVSLAVAWKDNQIIELPGGENGDADWAVAVNNHNQIVGNDLHGAVLWNTNIDGDNVTFTMVDLNARIVNNTTIPTFTQALDINDSGQILCEDANSRLYLLTPYADTQPPTAAIDDAPPLQSAGGSTYDFTVAYSDNGIIDTSSFDGSDIVVTAPDGTTKLPASFVKYETGPGDLGHSYIATYRINAPGDTWDGDDDGAYTINLQSGQVSDLSGNSAAAANLGTFTVDTSYSGLLFQRGVVYSKAYPAGQQVFRVSYDIAYKGFVSTMRVQTPTGKWCTLTKQPSTLGERWSYQATGSMSDYTDGTYHLELSLVGYSDTVTQDYSLTVPGTGDPIAAPTQQPTLTNLASGAVGVSPSLSPAWNSITDSHVDEIGLTILDTTAKSTAYQRVLTDATRTSAGPLHLSTNHAFTLQLEFDNAYHTTNSDDIAYTVEKFIETDVSFTTAAGNSGPDLAALAGAFTLPDSPIPGDKGQLPVSLSNLGDAAAVGKTALRVYASADGQYDPTDLLLGAISSQSINLAPTGQTTSSTVVKVPLVIPAGLQPGRYHLVVRLENETVGLDANTNNNATVPTEQFDVSWKFGAFDDQHTKAKLHLTYQGQGMTLAMAGAGNGQVVVGTNGLVVQIHQTTATSTLTITPDKSSKPTLAGITSDNGLKSITAKGINLVGDLTVAGALTGLTLGDVTGAAITIGATATSDKSTALTLAMGIVHDASIDSQTPLKSLAVIEWLDQTGSADTIAAPWLGTLSTTGRKADSKNAIAASAGDFQADLTLAPRTQDSLLKTTLNAVNIVGGLSAASWNISGNIGTLKVARWTANRNGADRFQLRASGNISAASFGGAKNLDLLAGMQSSLHNPITRDDFLSTAASISTFTITGWKLAAGETAPDWFDHTTLAAALLGTIKLINVDDTLGFDSYLCARANAGHEIKSVTVTILPASSKQVYPTKPPAVFDVPGLYLAIL